MTHKQSFAAEYDMPISRVELVCRVAKRATLANVAACNGDPHPGSTDPGDKNQNAKLHERDRDGDAEWLASLVAPHGFTAVVFTGLSPTLKRGEQYVQIPY